MKNTRKDKRRRSASDLYKVVIEPATATSPENYETFQTLADAEHFLDRYDLDVGSLYIWNDSRGRWSPPAEPANDRHTIAITIHLEIRASSDLAAQNQAIEVVEYFAGRILRHPAVEQFLNEPGHVVTGLRAPPVHPAQKKHVRNRLTAWQPN